MIFSYLVHLVILELIWCIHLPDEIYPKGSVAKPAYRHIQASKQISNELTSDAKKITSENYFPGVIYPTSILDIAQPFFYRENAQDQVLGPFSDDVKSSYKLISSKTGDSKNINYDILKYISQSQEYLESGTENDGNTCSEPSSKENEDNEEILSELSNENINNTFEDKFMTNIHNTWLSSSTSVNETDSVADVEENIASSHVEKDTSDEDDIFLENLEIPIEENVYEIYSVISDLEKQEIIQDNVTLNSKINLTNETNEVFLDNECNSKNVDIDLRQNISLGDHNLTSNKVIVMNFSETLPLLPVGCFESGNVTSNILTKSTEESSSLPLEESLNMSSKISCSNNTIGNLTYYNDTDLHPEKLLLITSENDIYSDYDRNCTDGDNDGPGSQDDSDDFFLDLIISLDSFCEMNDITSPNKENETDLVEISIIDRTNISLHDVNASQENI